MKMIKPHGMGAALAISLAAAAVHAQTTGVIRGSLTAPIAPTQSIIQALSSSEPSAQQLAAARAHMAVAQEAWAARSQGPAPAAARALSGPPPGTETIAGLAPNAPGTFTIFRNSTAAVGPAGTSSTINEPAHAASGQNVFLTWNWFAARSTNGGASWTGVNPFADLPDFCCDQDLVYDRARDMIIWSRQTIASAAGNNRLRIGRSNDGGANWCNYDLTGAAIGFPGQWFDYEHLAATNDYLYISTNLFNAARVRQRAVLLRIPLDALQACTSFSAALWTTTEGWNWTPVQGAREVMYLGDQIDPVHGIFRIYTQPEADTTLTFIDRVIAPWTFTNRDGTCRVSNGRNPCARTDQRILAAVLTHNSGGGTLSNGVLTFFWNVRQGGNFPLPYVEAASFSESTKSPIGRPFIWSTSEAWQYAAAAPNERGDIGLTVYRFAGNATPQVYAAIDDDYNGTPPGWEVSLISASGGNPNDDVWGDYSRVRPYYPGATAWSASVYTIGATAIAEPRFVIFGRDRDRRNVERWWDR